MYKVIVSKKSLCNCNIFEMYLGYQDITYTAKPNQEVAIQRILDMKKDTLNLYGEKTR